MMNVTPPTAETSEFAYLDALLRRAEQSIMLLDRATPRDSAIEVSRLIEAWKKGKKQLPSFVYGPAPDLSSLRAELVAAAERASGKGPLLSLYAERARELELEARLAEAVGQPKFAALAAERFPAPSGEDGDQTLALSRSYAGLSVQKGDDTLHASDDASDSLSLLSQMRKRVAELGLGVRVEVRAQAAVAAVGEGLITIRPRVWLSDKQAQRIVVHETLGHALPRKRAKTTNLGLLAVGSAKSAETEEGRALLVEERARLLDDERKRELGLRHLAATSVRRGANFRETADELIELGAPIEVALELATRVHRGGGLAREIVYLPAYLEVKRTLSAEPGLERWLERGRVSLAAARVLESEFGKG